MPKLLKIVADAEFPKRSKAPDAAGTYAAAKAQGVLTQPYVTAMENVKTGLYKVVPDESAHAPAPAPARLEDMPHEDLKVMLVQLGVRTQKQMKRSEIIKVIRGKLAEVEIVEDDAGEQPPS